MNWKLHEKKLNALYSRKARAIMAVILAILLCAFAILSAETGKVSGVSASDQAQEQDF